VLGLVVPLAASFGATDLDCPKSRTSRQCAEVAPAFPASALAAGLRSELASLMLDCHRPGWDGYGAEAVSADAYCAAERFIHSLPIGVEPPQVSADPTGCVTFEWRRSPRRTLLVSVRPGYAIDYAALVGTSKAYGVEPFFDDLPETIKTLIRRVVGV
jgi:hypothetical protein